MEFEYLPYRSITFNPKLLGQLSDTSSSKVLAISMILIIAVLGMLIWYLRYKTEKIEQRIEFEMTAIRNERDNEIDSSRTDIVRH